MAPDPHAPLLQVRGLTARYGHVRALEATDLTVDRGELVAILGPNGAGKSTLLRAILGLVANTGEVRSEGVVLPRADPVAVASAGIVLVPEGRGIFGPMTVAENLRLGAYRVRDRREVERRLARTFELFPRLSERLGQTAGSMSGGEQQMVAIGRALLSRPRLLLLDEPSMGLAPLVVEKIFEVIRSVAAEGVTILLVEQNANLALEFSQRAYVMESGRITLAGSGAELLADPKVRAAYLGE